MNFTASTTLAGLLALTLSFLSACKPSADAPASGTTTPTGSAASPTITATARVSGSDAKALVAAGAKLIDVRSPEEFSEGHVAGAVNIPIDALESRLGDVGAKDQPVVLYCRSGGRSGRASSLLRNAGFTKVNDLGPMSAWDR